MPALLILNPSLFYLFVAITGLVSGVIIAFLTHWLPKRLDLVWRHEAKSILQLGNEPLQSAPRYLWATFVSYLKVESNGVSPRTTLTGLAGMVICWLITVKFGASLNTLGLCVLGLSLLALSIIDFETQLLPDCIVFPILWLGLIMVAISDEALLANALWGVVVGYLILWLPASLYGRIRGITAMGHGDFKLLALIGAWLGWQNIPVVLLIACVAGALGGIFTLVKNGKGIRSAFPFGPYLAIAGLIVLVR